MAIRTHNKKGIRYSEKDIQKKIDKGQKTLFGSYDWTVDKKTIVWEKVADLYPRVDWLYNRNQVLSKENYDMTDASCAVLGFMNKINQWDPNNR